ncbi:MAG: TAXI family TRAP transporter solute-binding subunit [Ectothiorhodospiraceae bacterium]|jgi:TRAP transporter TAXI family solute receptor|nr:TAXI family TRAP transporter solute-binding subunit [Ectothiorhodospiraceae bacterium]
MKRSLIAILTLACVALSAQPVFAAKFITVLTGGTSGVYYPLGVALSNIYGEVIPDAKTSVQATKASVENLNLLNAKRGEVALTLGDTLSHAAAGNEEVGFKAPLSSLRVISPMHTNYIQIVARADSGIKTLADLKGKRISVGAAKSGTELNARAVLAAAGMSYADFSKVEYLGYAESVELLKNRHIDVTLQSSGLGSPALRDLANSNDVVFVTIPADVVAKVGDAAYVAGVIPAGTYKGQDQDVATAAVRNYLVTHQGLDDDTVYAMTKAMFEHMDQMIAAHAAARGVKIENAADPMPVPLHPGAARYYRERGIIQ